MNRRLTLESIGPCIFADASLDRWLIGRTEQTARTPEGLAVYAADAAILEVLEQIRTEGSELTQILMLPKDDDMGNVWDAARAGAVLVEHLNDAVAGVAIVTNGKPRLVYDYGKCIEVDGVIRQGQDPFNDALIRRIMELDMGEGSPILASLPFLNR